MEKELCKISLLWGCCISVIILYNIHIILLEKVNVYIFSNWFCIFNITYYRTIYSRHIPEVDSVSTQPPFVLKCIASLELYTPALLWTLFLFKTFNVINMPHIPFSILGKTLTKTSLHCRQSWWVGTFLNPHIITHIYTCSQICI